MRGSPDASQLPLGACLNPVYGSRSIGRGGVRARCSVVLIVLAPAVPSGQYALMATSDESHSLATFAAAKARAEVLAPRLVGLTEQAAKSVVAAEHCVMRVVSRDGERWPLTADGCASRIDVVVANGRLVEARARG
jgi:hypothetical protein